LAGSAIAGEQHAKIEHRDLALLFWSFFPILIEMLEQKINIFIEKF
jgi:hypothetical protein